MSIKNPREILSFDMIDNQKSIINKEAQSFDSKYIGKVIDNNDPDQEGKCKVRVYGIFDNIINDEDIPWAIPEFGLVQGNFTIPEINTLVSIYFSDGELYHPVYSRKAWDTSDLPSTRLKDYPDTIVLLEMTDGSYITANRKSNIITVHHKTGSEIAMEQNGDLVLHGKNNIYIDTSESVMIGSGTGYLVSSSIPGQIVTQDGHILNATTKLRG